MGFLCFLSACFEGGTGSKSGEASHPLSPSSEATDRLNSEPCLDIRARASDLIELVGDFVKDSLQVVCDSASGMEIIRELRIDENVSQYCSYIAQEIATSGPIYRFSLPGVTRITYKDGLSAANSFERLVGDIEAGRLQGRISLKTGCMIILQSNTLVLIHINLCGTVDKYDDFVKVVSDAVELSTECSGALMGCGLVKVERIP